MRTRLHREWFMPRTSYGKMCPNCGEKLSLDERVYAWGQYASGKWNTIMHFCRACFETDVLTRLNTHTKNCRCTFEFCPRSGYPALPEWLAPKEENRCV